MRLGGAALLAARYPRIWHVIEADGAGPWLIDTGLWPAGDLRAGGVNRDDFLRVDLGDGRSAVLRPQQMQTGRLLPTLGGAFAGRPEAWRQHVDRHVFFWADARRRDAFAGACLRLRGAAPPVMLAIDTAALFDRYGSIGFFSSVNVGSTLRGGSGVRRDEHVLRPVARYQGGSVAEVAVRGRVDLARTLDPNGGFPSHTAAHQ